MKQVVIIILLLSIHSTYGMKGSGRKRSNSTSSSPTQLRHKDSQSTLAHSDPSHIKNDPLFDLYKNLNQKVTDQGSKIDSLTTKTARLETKVTYLTTITIILVTSGMVSVVWYKWPDILPLLRKQ